MAAPLIVGLAGHRLEPSEREFLAKVRPLGIIIFARNVASVEQVTELVAEAKAAAGADLAFVDQEGGRVQRLRPPLAPRYPPSRAVGDVHAADPEAGKRAAWLQGRLIAADLTPLGLDSPCLPVADVPAVGSNDVIGDRAYGSDPETVSDLAGAAAEGVLDGGALPVMKHIPGHGRAMADSHFALPAVDASRENLAADFAPFSVLAALPMAMTAHVKYGAIDPERAATVSPAAIGLIRDHIGFDGFLMTDDISMGALRGDIATNARAALDAGCDCVLHCNGKMGEMEKIAEVLPPMAPEAADRLARGLAVRRSPSEENLADLRQEFANLLNVGP
ncbi:MAG: beta-N-acetylhexosaminidase [Pseudomonadota bacterium]